MNNYYIKIIAAAAIALLFASCQVNETDLQGNASEIGKNTVAFSVGGVDTRSYVANSDYSKPGVSIPLGTDKMGNTFYLEESVIDLNSPITRGTPAYTENVVTLYDGELFAHSELGNDTYKYEESSKCYTKSYGKNIWDVADPLNFWMYMPVELTSYGVTADPTFAGGGSTAQTISFSYKSPATAAAQADIIFAARSIDETTYENNERKMNVLFHHALTGVKFAIGNDDDDIEDNDIAITKISFTGLYDKGSCVVTPTTEGGEYQDIANNHSSASDRVVVWTLDETRVNESIYSEFGTTDKTTFAQPTEGNGSFTNEGEYPASFAQKGNVNNLNDGDATKTFWLIPQQMTNNVKLTINYSFGDKNDYEWTIDFGKALSDVIWKAGQLRTYTIRIDEVNVMIEDKIDMAEAKTQHYETDWGEEFELVSYEGSKKTDVTITNTGNTDAFIRAALIGQWMDENGNPVFGFTDYTHGIQLVDSWYQDQFVKTTPGTHGAFVGLPGYKGGTNPLNNWKLENDGYYYYTEIVPAGEEVPNNLFTSYTVGKTPGTAVAGMAKNVYFKLEIATQAISAKKLDGSSYTSYTEAWANANAQE